MGQSVSKSAVGGRARADPVTGKDAETLTLHLKCRCVFTASQAEANQEGAERLRRFLQAHTERGAGGGGVGRVREMLPGLVC